MNPAGGNIFTETYPIDEKKSRSHQTQGNDDSNERGEKNGSSSELFDKPHRSNGADSLHGRDPAGDPDSRDLVLDPRRLDDGPGVVPEQCSRK